MRRREFITLLGSGAATWPLATHAQQPPAKVFRIGFLGLTSANSLPERFEAFRAGLRDLGYREARDFLIEYRWANDKYDQLPALLDDLIRLKVDVIVTHGTQEPLPPNRPTQRSQLSWRSWVIPWRQVSCRASRGQAGT
jgi:putative tryptophan/tyrosine transport system substrate-binding protein